MQTSRFVANNIFTVFISLIVTEWHSGASNHVLNINDPKNISTDYYSESLVFLAALCKLKFERFKEGCHVGRPYIYGILLYISI